MLDDCVVVADCDAVPDGVRLEDCVALGDSDALGVCVEDVD